MASQTFSSSGSWTAPGNLLPGSVQVYAWGEGGNGAAGSSSAHSGAGGGAGSLGGEPALGGITAGTVLTVTIGTGGTGTATTVTGGLVTVTGNVGGNASGITAGTGGTAPSNTVSFAGGAGGAGRGTTASAGGAGGGSAGSTGAGGAGTASTGPSATAGGTAGSGAAGPPSLAGATGGAGGADNAAGSAGIAPGSGGGGGGDVGSQAAGTGAAGQVIIIWLTITPGFGGPAVGTGAFAGSKSVAGKFRGVLEGLGGPLPVRVVNQWAATFAQPASFEPTPPALQSTVVSLTPAGSVGSGSGYPTQGNWLFCLCGWNQDGLPAVTAGDADDIHSFWRPGNVSTSTWAVSQSAANTRTSVWYTPNLARQPADVYAAPSGAMAGMACLVIEVSGLGPWDTVTGIYTNYAAAATSLSLALGAPSGQAFLLAAVTGDNDSAGQAFAPSGWRGLHTVTATNGSDHTCDAVLTSACLTTSGSVSVSGTASSTTDLSGVIIGVLTSATSPIPTGGVIYDDIYSGTYLDTYGVPVTIAPPNPVWPGRMIAEAAFGSGYETPPDQCVWTTLLDSEWPGTWSGSFVQFKRLWGWTDKSGIPWGLGQYQSSNGTMTLDNWDGSLSPSNVGGLYYSNAINQNMSFQSGVSPWTAQNSAALAQSSAQVYASAPQAQAQYSAQVTPNGSTADPGIVSEQDAVSPSSPYSVSAWVYSVAGYATGAQVAISWYTSASALISTVTSTALAIPAAAWTQVELLNQTSPSNAAYAAITVQFAGTPSAAPFWVAEAALVSGAAVVQTGRVTSGTPVRIRMALGTVTTRQGSVTYDRWYCWQRNAQSWPETRNEYLHNRVIATTTDPWQSSSATCYTPYRGEVAQDQPYAWWPMDDQPLTGGVLPSTLRNAAAGNTNVLNIVRSPLGTGPTFWYSIDGTNLSSYFGSASYASELIGLAQYTVAANSGWMYGDPQVSPSSAAAASGNPVTASPGSASWQVSGQQGDTGSYSWFLSCNDPDFPPLSGGATVEGWFLYPYFGSTAIAAGVTAHIVAQEPYAPMTLCTLTTGSAPVAVLQLDISGHLNLVTYNGTTPTSNAVYTSSDLRANTWHHYTVVLTQTTWTVYIDGGATATVSGTATGMTSAWSWLIVNGDMGTAGGGSTSDIEYSGNTSVSHFAVYAGQLPAWRIRAHYWAAISGFGQLPAPTAATITSQDWGAVAAAVATPDGQFPSIAGGGYAPGGFGFVTWTMSVVTVAQAGAYTSGPSPWGVGGGYDDNTVGRAQAVSAVWTGLAPEFAVYNSTQIGNETQASITAGPAEDFSGGYGSASTGYAIDHLSGGSGATVPSASAIGDTVQQRIERDLGYGGLTVPMRAIDPASLLVQAGLDVGGQSVGANVTNVVQSDMGWLFYDTVGVLCYRDRPHLNSDGVTWYIGMNVPAGYSPFKIDIAADNDPTRVYTAITMAPYSPGGTSLPDLVPANSAAVKTAQAQYGARPLPLNSYLQSTSEAQSAVNWAFSYYGTLRKRIAVLTIDAASHPAAWGLVLSANVSDIVQVYDQPLGARDDDAVPDQQRHEKPFIRRGRAADRGEDRHSGRSDPHVLVLTCGLTKPAPKGRRPYGRNGNHHPGRVRPCNPDRRQARQGRRAPGERGRAAGIRAGEDGRP